MKNNVLFISLCLLPVVAFAQKEVYFTTIKSEDVKVRPLQGIEINSMYNFGFPLNDLFVGYFNEIRLGYNTTLIASAGVRNSIFKQSHFQFNGESYVRTGEYFTALSFRLQMAIEPRWYWGFKKRFESGTATLNSGWFLSLPISIEPFFITTPDGDINKSWIPNTNYESSSFSITIGYRQALSERFFFEGQGGVSYLMSWYNNQGVNLQIPQYVSTEISPYIKLKAAYTFK